ncbi:serine hydrolase domain-containing protein [Dyella flagellata]|uniref:Serine hydrolase n=1 Tax=Dyella flagellata TaxID=1867833 RepID=A0ABQ5XB25_9GAMM|nr:serine hydrolase domain-containing protein [Dyella flagellata]GLQ88268.1 serine hydrolase [Dyella flagellata]
MAKWLAANLSAEVTKHISAQELAQSDFEMCTDNGGFRLVNVTQSSAHSVTVLVNGVKSHEWFKTQLAMDDAGRVVRYFTFPTTPPESALPKDLGDAAIAREVSEVVAEKSRDGSFSGIVVVARGTQIIASASAGYADRVKKTPISSSTQFTLASMGKMFTAASIGQLVDQKKMSFDDTVGKFFPDYPNQTVRNKVTVGMLLSHTSGMGDFLGARTPEMMKHGVKRAEEFMPLYDKDEPKFAPGTSWAYSNAGLALAGAIVEKVSGEDYPSYIRKHIFAAAGMTGSDPNNIPYSGAKLVVPYTRMTEQGPSKTWHEAERDIGSPAGGSISTADDLVRFASALRDGKLESKVTFDQMVKSRTTKAFGDENYGYAMEIENIYGRTVVGHGGGFQGVSTDLSMILGSPYTVVILANQDPPAAKRVGSAIVALVVEKAKSGQ